MGNVATVAVIHTVSFFDTLAQRNWNVLQKSENSRIVNIFLSQVFYILL
jgi:hypothetical protein